MDPYEVKELSFMLVQVIVSKISINTYNRKNEIKNLQKSWFYTSETYPN